MKYIYLAPDINYFHYNSLLLAYLKELQDMFVMSFLPLLVGCVLNSKLFGICLSLVITDNNSDSQMPAIDKTDNLLFS